MANIGEKRTVLEREDADRLDEETLPAPAKKPATVSFNFRPSPLQQATRGFSLKQSSLIPPHFGSDKSAKSGDNLASVSTSLQGGFLKLDSNELRPIATVPLGAVPTASNAFRSSPGSLSESESGGGGGRGDQVNEGNGNGNGGTNNLFLQFLTRTSSSHTTSTTSSPSSSLHITPDMPTNTHTNEEGDPSQSDVAIVEGGSLQPSNSNGTVLGGAGVQVGFERASAILPEVNTVTGEEKEKKIVQIPARLYVFDVTTHTWKERGRGDMRLNDAARSEGLFQSRLVMRSFGSYRLLLNTHLWAQMKCDRANLKSLRITAQHGDQGEVGVFLITGAAKDIQQLFTAVDRRIEALVRNLTTDVERDCASSAKDNAQVPFDDDDKESFLDEPHSSPDSSPDCRVRSRTRLAPTIDPVAMATTKKAEGEEIETEGSKKEEEEEEEEEEEGDKNLCGGGGDGVVSDKESSTATPSSSRSPSLGASTTTISSSDNAPETNFSQ